MKSLIFWFCSICWLLVSFVIGAWLDRQLGIDYGTVIVFVGGGVILLGLMGYIQHLLVQWVIKLRAKGHI